MEDFQVGFLGRKEWGNPQEKEKEGRIERVHTILIVLETVGRSPSLGVYYRGVFHLVSTSAGVGKSISVISVSLIFSSASSYIGLLQFIKTNKRPCGIFTMLDK